MVYKINEKNISEDNIDKFILERKDRTYKDIYLELENVVSEREKEDQFCSIKYNYTPIFLYHMIKNDIPASDFAKVLNVSDYEKGLDSFFKSSDYSYDDVLDEEASIWAKMSYLFYKSNGNRIVFDENKMSYVKEILKNVHEDNLLDFHSSGIHYFITHIIYISPEKADELFNLIEENPLLLKEQRREYLSLPGNILRNIADASYENDVSKYYELFKNSPLMKKEMDEKIINTNFNDEFDINLPLMNMMLKSEEPNNLIDYINERFKVKVIKEHKNKLEKQYNLYGGLFVSLDKINFDLDCSKINTESSWKDNYIYLSALNILLEEGRLNSIKNVTPELISYVSEFSEEKLEKNKSFKEEYWCLIRIFQNDIEEKLKKIMDYQSLNEQLPEKQQAKVKFKM